MYICNFHQNILNLSYVLQIFNLHLCWKYKINEFYFGTNTKFTNLWINKLVIFNQTTKIDTHEEKYFFEGYCSCSVMLLAILIIFRPTLSLALHWYLQYDGEPVSWSVITLSSCPLVPTIQWGTSVLVCHYVRWYLQYDGEPASK
jgi:hypothetical protein